VALLAEVADQEGLQAEAGVVGGQGDAHRFILHGGTLAG
jgi:hypothetical protein